VDEEDMMKRVNVQMDTSDHVDDSTDNKADNNEDTIDTAHEGTHNVTQLKQQFFP